MTKRILVIIAIIVVLCLIVVGTGKVFNYSIFDTTWKFDRAYVYLPDGHKVGEVASWMDYQDSDMVQVKFQDGSVYYTHGSNIVLITDAKE